MRAFLPVFNHLSKETLMRTMAAVLALVAIAASTPTQLIVSVGDFLNTLQITISILLT
jgi:hypothetical protein